MKSDAGDSHMGEGDKMGFRKWPTDIELACYSKKNCKVLLESRSKS
jgi:hypothetical protein